MTSWLFEQVGAAYELARLAVISKFRFKGPYWHWRLHTAFGLNHPGRAEMAHSVWAYARWVHRMRSGRG